MLRFLKVTAPRRLLSLSVEDARARCDTCGRDCAGRRNNRRLTRCQHQGEDGGGQRHSDDEEPCDGCVPARSGWLRLRGVSACPRRVYSHRQLLMVRGRLAGRPPVPLRCPQPGALIRLAGDNRQPAVGALRHRAHCAWREASTGILVGMTVNVSVGSSKEEKLALRAVPSDGPREQRTTCRSSVAAGSAEHNAGGLATRGPLCRSWPWPRRSRAAA